MSSSISGRKGIVQAGEENEGVINRGKKGGDNAPPSRVDGCKKT
jgi:hypothetical protein